EDDHREKIQKAETSTQGKSASPSHESGLGKAQQDEQKGDQPETSQAKPDWEYQKRFENADNEHLDALMEMIGLESVKQQVLTIKTKIDTSIRHGVNVKDERFGAALLGNPGTGKTTVARLYSKFLASSGVLPGTTVEETTGARLASDGVQACKKLIEEVLNDGGGAIFIDEAHQLTSKTSYGGGQVLDFLLAEVENLTGKIVFILAGYNKQMEGFFARNPGFGNARAVENAFSRVLSRQATRLTRERRAGKTADDMLSTQEDLIGPEPSNALDGFDSIQEGVDGIFRARLRRDTC
ncbi:MAG: hypothetical protein L6R38_005763, partial [Xanthoria sp. 2 TBL-2021]